MAPHAAPQLLTAEPDTELVSLLDRGDRAVQDERRATRGAASLRPAGRGSGSPDADLGPARRERHTPGRVRPRDVGDRGPSKNSASSAKRGRSTPRSHDQPVDDAGELLPGRLTEPRLAAPAAEDGHVRDQQRQHDRRRGDGVRFPRRTTRSPRCRCGARRVEAPHRNLGVEAVRLIRVRNEKDRARRMALGHAAERLLRPPRAIPAAPRRNASSRSCACSTPRRSTRLRRRASSRSISRDRRVLAVPVLGQCRRHERPSRWISSSAEGGPQLPAA